MPEKVRTYYARKAPGWRCLPYFLWLFLFLPACASADNSRALLELSVSPALLQADGNGSVTIQYKVAREAVVTLALRSADETTFVLRDRVPRGPGTFSFAFRGAVDGRVLPDGQYEVVATARESTASDHVELQKPLTITNADTAAPALDGLQVTPELFTPNQDGVDDRLEISFTIAEPVVVDVRLLAGDETRWLMRNTAADPGTVHASWPPPLRHAPQLNQAVENLPAGPAEVEVTIQDRAGNRTVQRRGITLGEAGTPQVQVADVQISPTAVQAGTTITVTATIINNGTVTLRAAPLGPSTYAWGEDAPSLRFTADTGTVRWGVEFSLNRSGVAFPFRWSLGRDLAPGESVAVTGKISVNEDFPQEPVQLWIGVIHENNRLLADRRSITRVQLVNSEN